MSFSDTVNAKKFASIAETAAAQAKLFANNLENAPDYADQAATSALAAAASAQVAVSAEGVVNNLVISASDSATSAASSAAIAGEAVAAAVGQCLRVPDGEVADVLPEAQDRLNTFLIFDENGNASLLPESEVAILDSEGKIPVSMVPAIALNNTFVVGSQAAMLALDAQIGDVAKRTDLGYSFILSADPASLIANWVQLNDDVLAQLGQSTGATQVGAVDDSATATTVQGALNLKSSLSALSSAIMSVFSDFASTAINKGAHLLGFKQSYTGSVARTAYDKFAEFVSVKDFGALGDGATDDTAAIQAAINARMRIWFPPGIYVISASLIFSNQQIIGSGCSSGADRGTILQCNGRFAAFKRDTGGYSPGGRIQGFYINFGASIPTDSQDPTAASRGIHMGESTDTLPNGSTMFIIEDIVVRGAYYGFYDYGYTYLCEYRNCWARNCWLGFRKQGGTTIKYSTCYALACYAAWWVNQCYVVTYTNCAYDQTVTNKGFRPFKLEQCRAVTVNGLDHEAGQINNSGTSDAIFLDCSSVVINGWVVVGHSVTNTTGEAYLMQFDGTTQAVVNGLKNETSTSAGSIVYAILASGDSKVKVSACNLQGWKDAGTNNNISLGTTGNGIIIKDETCVYAGLVVGKVWMNGCIGSISSTITTLQINANSLAEIGSLTINGVLPTDTLAYSFDGDYQRCIFQARYIGANTINFTIFNTSATTRTISGTLTVYAVRYK